MQRSTAGSAPRSTAYQSIPLLRYILLNQADRGSRSDAGDNTLRRTTSHQALVWVCEQIALAAAGLIASSLPRGGHVDG